ncbi:hypothetical protein [Streptomyces sp. NPDC127197]|uniref:hypothetical protein n=1 Tax=Streptomyces sp. NPDC127197 TaxID=3345388 RepID=UPI00363FA92F
MASPVHSADSVPAGHTTLAKSSGMQIPSVGCGIVILLLDPHHRSVGSSGIIYDTKLEIRVSKLQGVVGAVGVL